jgi:dipeptidyl-peptidase-4
MLLTLCTLFVYRYGGPNSVKVSDRWTGDWGTYLTTNRSIIYGAIDGRGSGLKGNNVLFSNFRRLGTLEIEDQINVTKYVPARCFLNCLCSASAIYMCVSR